MDKDGLRKQLLFKKLFRLARKRWYVLALSLTFTLSAGFLINKIKPAKWRISATILSRSAQNSPSAMIFEGGNPAMTKTSSLLDQTVLLRSFPVIAGALEKVEFGISYYEEKWFRKRELYVMSPVTFELSKFTEVVPYDQELVVEHIDTTNFFFIWKEKKTKHAYGTESEVDGLKFTINLARPDNIIAGKKIFITINRYDDAIFDYRRRISISPVGESSVLRISVIEESPNKGVDFLNALTKAIVEQDLRQKNFNSDKTIEFIDEQLAINTDTLQNIEENIKNFKQENSAQGLSLESNNLFGSIKSLEEEKAQILISNQYFDYLLSSLDNDEALDNIAVPTSVGVDDPILATLVNQYINTQLEVKMLKDNNSKNPILLEKKSTINELKQTILVNVKNRKAANDIALNDINRRIRQYEGSLQKLPDVERKMVNIQRLYSLNENINMLLMQKRIEAGIASASNISDYQIVENALVDGPPLSASGEIIMILAFIAGVGLPAGIWLLMVQFGTALSSKEEVKLFSDRPILGSVIQADEEKMLNQQSLMYEKFRQIRANLMYFHSQDKSKIIMLTSSHSGEGKSFCSWYLGMVIALGFKKAVVVGADLRKPVKERYSNQHGLAEYLAGFAQYEQIIQKSENQFLDFVLNGKVPPNPSELILSDQMKVLLQRLRQDYDFIIIDTPPVGLVADAMALLPDADLLVCVVREKVTQARALQETMDKLEETAGKKLSIIYNGSKGSKKDSYYYYYGKNGHAKKKHKGRKKKLVKV
jgi:capsular exopolysaccharide synthesis family protein